MVELFVQSDFADAPAVIWIAGNLAAACASDGARGHRHLLLRAGAAAHRLWMAALASGLNGSIVAGLVPGAARRLLGFDGYKTASLLAFAAGHRREDPTNLALNGHP
jgi:nitroreductase